MDINYISVAMLVIYIAVFVWQLNLINTLKSKLDVLERFQAIFDVKKFEDYSNFLEKKHSKELHQAVHNKVSKEIHNIIKDQVGDLSTEFKERWAELLYLTAIQLEEWNEVEKEDFFRSFPLNEANIRELWQYRKDKKP